MPGALAAIRTEDEARSALGAPPSNPENTKLWLPSELPAAERDSGCQGPLPAMECKLREAQCHEALDAIRNRLHAKQHLIHRRNKNVTGQNRSTRARTLIGRVGDRIKTHQLKYARARTALWALGGESQFAGEFKDLLPEHLVLDAEAPQADHEAHRQMRKVGGGDPRAPKKVDEISEGKKVLSWIWVAGDIPSTGEDLGVHACK